MGESNEQTTRTDFLELYRIAFQSRNFEITLLWQRSNYFLVLNSALAVGFFTHSSTSGGSGYLPFLTIFGLLSSILWIRIHAGSKYWQTRWEHRLAVLEEELNITPTPYLFASTREVDDEDVKKGLRLGTNGRLSNLWDSCVIKKPSVSRTMTMLAFLFMLAWLGLLLKLVIWYFFILGA